MEQCSQKKELMVEATTRDSIKELLKRMSSTLFIPLDVLYFSLRQHQETVLVMYVTFLHYIPMKASNYVCGTVIGPFAVYYLSSFLKNVFKQCRTSIYFKS